MNLLVSTNGEVRCLYGETINLHQLGHLKIRRGSLVEPDAHGWWHAELAPVGGPKLGPFPRRSEALAAEALWLDSYWLATSVD